MVFDKRTIDSVGELAAALADPDARVRTSALKAIVRKRGSDVVLTLDDPAMIPMLRAALDDPDERVKGGAAYALRPWTKEDPELFADVLPQYAIHTFDGTYTHLGLLDTESGEVWIPPWQATKGHAALMRDGNTDRYFKFEFYLPDQTPAALRRSGQKTDAHLLVHYICDWSYQHQRIVDDEMTAISEQEAYERQVVGFFRECDLGFGVVVHRKMWRSGQGARNQYGVGRV